MPSFNPKPSEVSGLIQPLPKDLYEFVIGEPKVIFKKDEATGETLNHGMSYTLTVADGEYAGKKAFPRMYMHTQDAAARSKQFQIAAYGFTVDNAGEGEFNATYGDADWSYDTDTGAIGQAWLDLKGKRVKCEVGLSKPTEAYPNPSQQFNKWFPIS